VRRFPAPSLPTCEAGAPRPGVPIEIIGAFESTYLPAHDVDIIETSGHATRWREDLLLLRELGVTRLR
jgi:hypothetical protein